MDARDSWEWFYRLGPKSAADAAKRRGRPMQSQLYAGWRDALERLVQSGIIDGADVRALWP